MFRISRRPEPTEPASPPSSPEALETHWLSLAAQGDRPAFEKLYRTYHPRLARFIERMTQRPLLVEELINDTMLVVWKKSGTFTGTSKVSTWVFGIAYRHALRALRDLDEPLDYDPDHEFDPGMSTPESLMSGRQTRRAIDAALATLSVDHRMVVALTYFHGASYPEIAAVMNCPVDTVKTRMFHAKRRLRLLLATEEREAP